MIAYLIVGVLTTAVDYLTFWLCGLLLGDSIQMVEISNIISWVAAVIFAFFTNKRFVFAAGDWDRVSLLKEGVSFAAGRLMGLFFSMAFIYGAVEWFSIPSMIAKLLSSVGVMVINYIWSKLVVFRKKKGEE